MLLSCSDVIAIHEVDKDTKPSAVSSKHRGKVNISMFNHNCRVIASGGEDGVINFHNSNLDYLSCIEDADVQGGEITSSAFNNNSSNLAYASNLGHMKVWDLKTSNTQLNYKLNSNYVTSMCFNQDSTHLSVGTLGGEIIDFNMVTYSPTNFKFQSYFKLNFLQYSSLCPNLLGASFEDGAVRIVDMNSGEVVNNYGGYHQGAATGIAFSPINKVFLCSVGSDAKVNFYDITAKKHIKTITTDASLTSVCFNSDGKTVAMGNTNGTIVLYDLRFCTAPKAVLTGHNTSVNYLEFAKRVSNINTSNSSSVNVNKTNTVSNSKLQDQSMKSNRSLSSIDSNIPYHMQGNFNAQGNPQGIGNNKSDIKMKMSKSHFSDVEQSFDKKRNEGFSNNTFANPVGPLPKSNTMTNLQDSNSKMAVDNSANNSLEIKSEVKSDVKSEVKSEVKSKPKFNLNLKNIESSQQTSQTANKNAAIETTQQNYNNLETVDEKMQNFIKTCIETEMFKMRQFIHEEINSLHIDLVRQFEIQHTELIKSLKNFSMINSKMTKEVEKLKKENKNLKSQFF